MAPPEPVPAPVPDPAPVSVPDPGPVPEPEPRQAATVVLLRDGRAGIEAWLLTRAAAMVFAAGMSVFPGGRVDVADQDVPLAGRPATELAAILGRDVRSAGALVAAAVRETYEETGLLLTVPPADLPAERAEVERGRLGFGALLRAHGLAADAAAVRPWSRWITPAGEVRRYDTTFFVAALPAGARAEAVTDEASRAEWLAVTAALEAYQRGERALLAPTLRTLQAISGHARVADVLAAAAGRSLAPVRPVLHRPAGGRPFVELPDGSTLPVPGAVLP